MTNTADGTISINSDRAVAFRNFDNAGDTVEITNAGSITAGRHWALDLTAAASASIMSSGTISSLDDYAIDLTGASHVTIVNAASGVISASASAILLESVGGYVTITNEGEIVSASSTINGTLLAGEVDVTITNSGLISASGSDAVHLLAIASSPTIVNTGIIRAGVVGSSAEKSATVLWRFRASPGPTSPTAAPSLRPATGPCFSKGRAPEPRLSNSRVPAPLPSFRPMMRSSISTVWAARNCGLKMKAQSERPRQMPRMF